MDRRDFLKIAGIAGLAVLAPRGSVAEAGAGAGEPYTGPLWLTVHAPRGWDPALLCDPKGKETGVTDLFSSSDIEEAGNIRYAPIPGHAAFFNKYKNRLCIVNGI